MRQAAQRPAIGAAGIDSLAASGGLEVPGHRPQGASPSAPPVQLEPIPGERDRSTLTGRQAGAIGGRPSGADTPPGDANSLMDEAT